MDVFDDTYYVVHLYDADDHCFSSRVYASLDQAIQFGLRWLDFDSNNRSEIHEVLVE